MTSLINRLNASNILNIAKNFKIRNLKISTVIIVATVIGSLAAALKIITDIIEIAIVSIKKRENPLNMIKVSKKEYGKLEGAFNILDRRLDFYCLKGFKGNAFFGDGYDMSIYARLKAITNPKFNPDNSKKFYDLIPIHKNATLLKDIRDKGFVIPKAKGMVIFDKLEFNNIMQKKAKDIYSDEGEFYITNIKDLAIIEESINKASRKEGEKIEKSDYYTLLGNTGERNFYLAIHKTNIKPHIDKIPTEQNNN